MRETMYYSSAKLLAVVLLLLVQWHSVTVSGAEQGCWEEERLALLQINATLTIPIHSAEGEWKGTDCCRWEGVTCGRTTGHVSKLDLSIQLDDDDYEYYADDKLFLNATIFLPLRQLTYLSLSGHGIPGFIDGAGIETWSNLTKLEVLDLSYNQLNGSIIFPLARISSLRELMLSENCLYSDAPMEGLEKWSSLTKLEILDLSSIDLDGSIIFSLARISSLRKLMLSNAINSSLVKVFESWTNLTQLEMLDLSYNYFNITKRFISSFSTIKSLRALYLDGSISEGHIPVREFSALNLEVLSLPGCGFLGSLPNLGALSSLKALSLMGNSLNGTLNSKGLCELNKLEELDLSDNSITGNLPLCMGNLSSLMLLDLSDNQFQVQFPSFIFERLVFLRFLSLSDNKIEGTLSMRSFLNHSNLKVLRLSTQALNFRVEVVNLPFQLQELELANCIINVEPTFLCYQHKLQVLDLSNTQSKGPIPVAWLLENNTNLNQLDLHKNIFTGPLQLPLPTHKQLSHLDISDNPLGGEIPIDITAKLPNLLFLDLSRSFLQGPLPLISMGNFLTLDLSHNNLTQDIKNVSSMISSQNILQVLNLSHNRLYGSLTNNMFTKVFELLLSDNNIRGEIPFNFCNTSFYVLDISNNKLNGILPDCIGIAYYALKLSGNHLEGSLPSQICGVEELSLLDLSNNSLSGPIPPCSNQSELQILKLSQNNLIGNFPITWLNISGIKVIDVQDNHLSGELPIRISTGSNLRMLQASKNLFEGHIPQQICQLKYLHILDLSGNNLFGQVPSCIINIGAYSPSVSNYWAIGTPYGVATKQDYELQLMSKGRLDMYWDNILSIEGLIDLSSNKLVGNIPNEIGQMIWLVSLNLSNNHFNGSIPISISNLSRLQSLDLSHNSLTGEIPRNITKLTSLESFSVAYNNLSGPTPDMMKAQFDTFGNSSYEGNPNLCGPPLSKSCFPILDTLPPSPSEMSKDTDFLILFGSFSLFFVISFWCLMAVLYFKRDWRYALFTLADRYGDMIYVTVVLLVRKIGAARTERDN